jgi:heme-degrading monooxygenase HmoA
MSLLRPLDPVFPIDRQVTLDASPVVLVNVFTLDKADEQTFLKAWQDDAVFMKQQPGFISTQLHRAIGESPTYLNYAVWQSTADFRAAFSHPAFRTKLSNYPSSAIASPHLFQKVAVPGICVA